MARNTALTVGVIALVVIAIAVVGVGGYMLFGPEQAAIGGGQITGGGEGGAATIVTTNPTINIVGQDNQQAGTAVSAGGSNQYSVNSGGFGSVTLGTTTAVPGQTLELLLVNDTTYHNAFYGDAVSGDTSVHQGAKFTVTASTFPITVKFNKNASITENLYNTEGDIVNGVLLNQTDLGNGASYTLKDEMSANALTSTQDMVCLIEIEAGQNASTSPIGATYNGAQPFSTAKPVWYSVIGGNSNVYLFNRAPISDTATKVDTIQLNSKSTGRFSAATRMVKTCYTKEYFLDSNTGKIAYDVADSLGTLQSMAQYTKTMYFD